MRNQKQRQYAELVVTRIFEPAWTQVSVLSAESLHYLLPRIVCVVMDALLLVIAEGLRLFVLCVC